MALAIYPMHRGLGDFWTTYIDQIKTAGSSYQIEGDPVVALVAQVNRFVGKNVAVGTCPSRNVSLFPSVLKGQKLPLIPYALDPARAGVFPGSNFSIMDLLVAAAQEIVLARYSCVDIDLWNKNKAAWAFDAGLKEVCLLEFDQEAIRTTGIVSSKLVCRPKTYEVSRQVALSWVKKNLREITETIAAVGDAAGLPPAEEGIKQRDPDLLPPKTKWGPYIMLGLGAVAVAAVAVFASARKNPQGV